MLDEITAELRARSGRFCDSTGAPGYVAGVYHGGEETVVAHGLANVVTKAPMQEETGFLLGSVTKVLTTTLLLRQVERGSIDLDEPVMRYMPEFTLADPRAAAELRVRHLVTHTDGISANFFMPAHDVKGRDALKAYVATLGACESLFAPGEYVSYSNAAFLVLGRLLEVVTGESYHDLLKREIYQEVGMSGSSVSAEEAILRSTAVGHFPTRDGRTRRTNLFMLPENWSACGGTPIVTIRDLLAFGRTHLNGGRSPAGRQVLSPESIGRMQTVNADMKLPNSFAYGLGWAVVPFGETTVLWHGGGSPGGSSALAVIPEYDFAFAAFGNHSRSGALHDELLMWLLRDYLGVDIPALVTETQPVERLERYVGTYRADQLRVEVGIVAGHLEQKHIPEPRDEIHRAIMDEFSGGAALPPPQRLIPVRDDLFAPEGMPLESFTSIRGRYALVSFIGYEAGLPTLRGMGGRLIRRRPPSQA